MEKDGNTIGKIRAVWDALRCVDMSYFPVLEKEDLIVGKSLDDVIIGEILAELKSVQPLGASAEKSGADSVMEKARETLDEVKALTEYQDQKATRLLTIISFLSALAAALFARFSTAYPLQGYLFGRCVNWRAAEVVVSYMLFAAFVLCVVGGALVV